MRLLEIIGGVKGRARVAAVVLAAASLVACAAAFAQSGRRPAKPQEIAPVPTPTPEPTPLPKPEPAEKIALVVVTADSHFFYSMHQETAAIHATVVTRLRQSKSLEVGADERRVSRGEALKRAREAQGKQYVVLLELRAEPGAEMSARRPRPEYFRIEYSVFEPGTGKQKTRGVAYPRAPSTVLGRAGLPGCYPAMVYEIEYIFGAIDAADRIMDSFSVPIPPHCS